MRHAVLLGVLVLLAPGATADEQGAAFFTARGTKALDAKDYKEAETQFRKALDEQPGYLPAVLGLAKAAKETGNKEEAVRQLETVLDAAGPAEPASAAAETVKAARDLLRALDRPRLEYRDMVEAYAAKLLALHEQYKESDPELARKCLDHILAVCPDHPRAQSLLSPPTAQTAPPAAPADPAAAPGETQLFNGRDFAGWAPHSPRFVVQDGKVVCSAPSITYFLYTEKALEGSYAVEYEARLTEGTTEDSAYGIGWGRRSQFELLLALVYGDKVVVHCQKGSADSYERLALRKNAEFKKPFDRTQWNLFRVDVSLGKLRFSVNGEEILKLNGPPGDFDGQVAVLVQQSTVEFRRIERVK